jgi:iron complex transport system substrate-binding protein
MTRRIWIALTTATLVASVVAGCGGAKATTQQPTQPASATAASTEPAKAQPKQTTYPITVKDAAGRDVTLASEPKRIVSVAPANTELVFALGKGANLVGRGDFDDYPAEAKNVPSIGGWMPPNYEKIVAAKPDLLLLIGGSENERNKLINDYKLNVFVLDPKNFDELYAGIKTLGVVLNAQEAAEKTVADMQATVKEVTDKVAKAQSKPKVYYEVWDEPLMTAGSGTFINDLITMAGGTNIGADVLGWANYSAEKVAAGNPDIIVASSKDDLDKVKARKGWESFKAVKENKVVTIDDPNLITIPGPRLVQGLQWFAKTIHPELFK